MNEQYILCSKKSSLLDTDDVGKTENCGTSDEVYVSSKISGLDRLRSKLYNKGLAFTLEERQRLGIHGLMPPIVRTLEDQVDNCMLLLNRIDSDLNKYMYLLSLSERNEKLFFRVVDANITTLLPIIYTPTIGAVCQKFSTLHQYPKGLFITLKDKGHVYDVMQNWPEIGVRGICVTDGERILGLGDLGANGMGIPIGKLWLYTALGGVKPQWLLPICLDVGTNTESILEDPMYIGLRQKRVSGAIYYEFLEEFMRAVVCRFGQNCLIQFEDFGNANAFQLLDKYRDVYCCFNDDIQGTAAVALGGIFASLKIKNAGLCQNIFLFFGAGEAAIGIANLCVMAMETEGLSEREATERIWMVDSKGLIVKQRPIDSVNERKARYAKDHSPLTELIDIVRLCKPTVLIGASAVGGAFTQDVLEAMAQLNEVPIIFALSNPTRKSECTAEQAYNHTNGTCIFSSGSPFAPVNYKDKTFYPSQGNNSYIFPGLALGVICCGMSTIPEKVFLIAAETLASLCSREELLRGSLYPSLKRITSVSLKIATEVVKFAYQHKLAAVRPRPKDIAAYLRRQMYDLNYSKIHPDLYTWSKIAKQSDCPKAQQ